MRTVKYRVVTRDHADDGTPIVNHHDTVDTFEEARMHAERLREQHAIVSVYRYAGGEPDVLWSSAADEAADSYSAQPGNSATAPHKNVEPSNDLAKLSAALARARAVPLAA
jgi:hypothetical protein